MTVAFGFGACVFCCFLVGCARFVTVAGGCVGTTTGVVGSADGVVGAVVSSGTSGVADDHSVGSTSGPTSLVSLLAAHGTVASAVACGFAGSVPCGAGPVAVPLGVGMPSVFSCATEAGSTCWRRT
ncbi:hypothetical protein [Nonomuraea salmonea]|uniref:hypothetical protein n=1 Tax=Nonomuraea salmonea TaxID=46181 RepID=UPI0031EE386F